MGLGWRPPVGGSVCTGCAVVFYKWRPELPAHVIAYLGHLSKVKEWKRWGVCPLPKGSAPDRASREVPSTHGLNAGSQRQPLKRNKDIWRGAQMLHFWFFLVK